MPFRKTGSRARRAAARESAFLRRGAPYTRRKDHLHGRGASPVDAAAAAVAAVAGRSAAQPPSRRLPWLHAPPALRPSAHPAHPDVFSPGLSSRSFPARPSPRPRCRDSPRRVATPGVSSGSFRTKSNANGRRRRWCGAEPPPLQYDARNDAAVGRSVGLLALGRFEPVHELAARPDFGRHRRGRSASKPDRTHVAGTGVGAGMDPEPDHGGVTEE